MINSPNSYLTEYYIIKFCLYNSLKDCKILKSQN